VSVSAAAAAKGEEGGVGPYRPEHPEYLIGSVDQKPVYFDPRSLFLPVPLAVTCAESNLFGIPFFKSQLRWLRHKIAKSGYIRRESDF
jgi:hypothetical protein